MQKEGTTRFGKGISFLVVTMQGISQVIFIENWLTGLFILAGITITSVGLGVVAILSSAIGTLVGKLGGADKKNIEKGLFGYNSVLTGMGLFLFLEGQISWGVALAGAAIAAIVTAAIMNVLTPLGMPVLTFPFIVTTWIFLVSSYRLKVFNLTDDLVPQDLSHWKLQIAGKIHWLDAFLDGAGQIFFLQNMVAGLLIFIGIFIASWKLGVYALVGNLFGMLAAYFLGGEHSLIDAGLYGYNAILSILAVGLIFRENNGTNWFVPISAIVSAVLTVLLIGSVDSFLLPLGLPALTMPFIISTWFFVSARKVLQHI